MAQHPAQLAFRSRASPRATSPAATQVFWDGDQRSYEWIALPALQSDLAKTILFISARLRIVIRSGMTAVNDGPAASCYAEFLAMLCALANLYWHMQILNAAVSRMLAPLEPTACAHSHPSPCSSCVIWRFHQRCRQDPMLKLRMQAFQVSYAWALSTDRRGRERLLDSVLPSLSHHANSEAEKYVNVPSFVHMVEEYMDRIDSGHSRALPRRINTLRNELTRSKNGFRIIVETPKGTTLKAIDISARSIFATSQAIIDLVPACKELLDRFETVLSTLLDRSRGEESGFAQAYKRYGRSILRALHEVRVAYQSALDDITCTCREALKVQQPTTTEAKAWNSQLAPALAQNATHLTETHRKLIWVIWNTGRSSRSRAEGESSWLDELETAMQRL